MRPATPTVGDAALWFALLGGPAAWTAHLLSSYALVGLACRLQTTLPLHLVTGLTALVSAAAALTGWTAWRKAGDDRVRFMAGTGAALAAFFVYVILVEGLPPLLQPLCGEGL